MITSTTFNSQQTQRDLPNNESRSSASSSVLNLEGLWLREEREGFIQILWMVGECFIGKSRMMIKWLGRYFFPNTVKLSPTQTHTLTNTHNLVHNSTACNLFDEMCWEKIILINNTSMQFERTNILASRKQLVQRCKIKDEGLKLDPAYHKTTTEGFTWRTPLQWWVSERRCSAPVVKILRCRSTQRSSIPWRHLKSWRTWIALQLFRRDYFCRKPI